MSSTMRWSLLVAAEAFLLLFLLRFGTTLFADVLQHRIQLVILASLGGLGWLVILWRPRVLPPILIVAPLPILASVAITSVFSRYPSLSGYATWQSAAYVGIAWLLAIQASHPVGRRNLIAVLGIAVTIVIAYFLVTIAWAWRDWLAIGFPVTSVPLRPDYSGGWVYISAWLADVVVLCAPVVAVSLWQRSARALALILAATAMAAIFLSGTRSVLLLIAAVVIVTVPFVVAGRGDRQTKVVSRIALASVATIGIAVILLSGRAFDEGRSSMIASAIDRFVESPVVGSGPGTYGVRRMGEDVEHLAWLAQSDAVNVVLTSASDSGIVGIAGLGLSVATYLIAMRRAFQKTAVGRPVILAAALASVVFAGHALGEFVFGLIGSIVLLVAVASIATTSDPTAYVAQKAEGYPLMPWMRALLGVGVIVVIASSAIVVRNENTRADIIAADAAIDTSPELALASARRATATSPDSVPAWWVRMVAADAVGDLSDAVAASRRTVSLEGFGQEWVSLGVLLTRSGDEAGARDAMDHAAGFTVLDSVVALNLALFYDSIGAASEAKAQAVRLLVARPDIEPILAKNTPGLGVMAAAVRTEAATAALAATVADGAFDPTVSFVIALSGEDRGLSTELLRQVTTKDPIAAEFWRTVVAAWFGDAVARTKLDTRALTQQRTGVLAWSWRLAIRACDTAAADGWARAVKILQNTQPSIPTILGVAPGFLVPSLPPRYPYEVWGIDHPQRPYVTGIWTYDVGSPPCSSR